MYACYNLDNMKLIGEYKSLRQCAKHIKKIDKKMIGFHQSLLNIFIMNNYKEISLDEYKTYKNLYQVD